MGYSNDDFPYVGAVPEKTGQYMCAGFTGHGMPQIFLAAKALTSMILTRDSEEVDLPLPYRISQERWLERKPHAALKMWQKTFDLGGAQARL
jgi:glycine/D-amino acid oxidase-like deaminating enzyme